MKSKPEDWWAVKTDSGSILHASKNKTDLGQTLRGEIEEYGKVYAEKKKRNPRRR